jgi:replicative DNA helicase
MDDLMRARTGDHLRGGVLAGDLLRDLDRGGAATPRARMHPHQTGFEPLDSVLHGGFRAHDLVLVGGLPGVGKTIATLQWARNVARAGDHAIFVCYEHDEAVLLSRLLTLEIGELAGPEDVIQLDELRDALYRWAYGGSGEDDDLQGSLLFRTARDRLEAYADRLWLVRGSGAHTTLAELQRLVDAHAGERTVLFVDYLQKVAVHPEPPDEAEKVTRIAEGVKELALQSDVAVVAVVAASQVGLDATRTRLHHLRGSSALAYECDVALILNEKFRAVSKVHLAYDPVRAERFKHQVVFSIEKNRGGQSLVDLEFDKDFPNYRFNERGGFVQERLVDERLNEE